MNCQKWKTGLLSGLMRIGYLRPSDKKWLQVKKVWMEIREGMELLCTIEASSSIINSYLLLFYLVHFFLFLPCTFLLFFSFYFVKRDPVYPTHWYIHERDVAFFSFNYTLPSLSIVFLLVSTQHHFIHSIRLHLWECWNSSCHWAQKLLIAHVHSQGSIWNLKASAGISVYAHKRGFVH